MKLNGKALWSDSDNEEGSSSCSREDDSGSDENASSSGDEASVSAPIAGPSSPGYVDLSTDPRMVVNAVVNKFEIEEAHYLPPFGTQDSKEGPSEPGQASKPRKPREKRTPSVEGGTLVDEEMLFNLRLDHLISDEVEFRVPTTEERADSPPEGYFTCMYHHIKVAFLWFPIPDVIVSFFWRHNLCFSQVTVQSFRNIVALLVRCYESGHSLSVREMRHFLQCTKGKKLNNHYFAPRPGYKLITHFPTKDPVWDRYYFFVKINSASIDGPLYSVKTEWQWRGRKRLSYCCS